MGKTHSIKVIPENFKSIKEGNKPFEILKNDKDFQVDDEINLVEWDPEKKKETGHYVGCKITYVLNNSDGLKKDYVVLGVSIQSYWINPDIVPYPETFVRESWKMGAVGVI